MDPPPTPPLLKIHNLRLSVQSQNFHRLRPVRTIALMLLDSSPSAVFPAVSGIAVCDCDVVDVFHVFGP